jgi:hypothetical protein
MFGYGVVRLIDGLDGEHGPGPAWTSGHPLFLAGLVLFGAVVVRLRRLVPIPSTAQRVTASVAMMLAVAGIIAFVRVIVLDLMVWFLAADNAEMAVISAKIGTFPGILPEAVWDLSPLLFEVGLLALTAQLAVLRQRRLAAWSPVLILVGCWRIATNLNLLPAGAAPFGLALSPVAWRPARDGLPTSGGGGD